MTLDLQQFFKDHSSPSKEDDKGREEIRERLDKTCQRLNDKLDIIGNRAVAVSVFLFISEFVDSGREDELQGFTEFLVKFLKTLKWQIPMGINMHPDYHHLLDFQTHVNQAAGEKYAIQNRHNYLDKAFRFYKQNGFIEGDDGYESGTGKKADDERG